MMVTRSVAWPMVAIFLVVMAAAAAAFLAAAASLAAAKPEETKLNEFTLNPKLSQVSLARKAAATPATTTTAAATTRSVAAATAADIFVAVKTTRRFHRSRLDLIIRTWFNLAKDQVRKFQTQHFGTIAFWDAPKKSNWKKTHPKFTQNMQS